MRFGVCTALENAPALAAIGFDYVEIHTGGLMALDDAGFAAFCAENSAAPIHAEAANCLFPGDMPLVGPDAEPDRIQAYIHRVMARLSELKVSTLVFGSGGCRRIPEGFPAEEAWKQMVTLCRMIGTEAAPYGITVALEPLRWEETNMINSVSEALKLVRETDHPNFRMLCDLYHFYQVGDSLSDLEACGDLLRHIHIAKPDDRRSMYSGDGMDYESFFRAVRGTGFDGRVSFEGSVSDFEKEMPRILAVLKAM